MQWHPTETSPAWSVKQLTEHLRSGRHLTPARLQYHRFHRRTQHLVFFVHDFHFIETEVRDPPKIGDGVTKGHARQNDQIVLTATEFVDHRGGIPIPR